MRYLLDTNIFIAAMKGNALLRERLERTPLSMLVLSPIVLGELQFGVEKSTQLEANRASLAALVERMEVAPIDAKTSAAYASLRALLERLGTPIGANDLWIAAHALALGATMVTDNVREFARAPGLAVENWLER